MNIIIDKMIHKVFHKVIHKVHRWCVTRSRINLSLVLRFLCSLRFAPSASSTPRRRLLFSLGSWLLLSVFCRFRLLFLFGRSFVGRTLSFLVLRQTANQQSYPFMCLLHMAMCNKNSLCTRLKKIIDGTSIPLSVFEIPTGKKSASKTWRTDTHFACLNILVGLWNMCEIWLQTRKKHIFWPGKRKAWNFYYTLKILLHMSVKG